MLKSKNTDSIKHEDEKCLSNASDIELPQIWNEVTKFYKLKKLIGKGVYGTVVSGKCLSTGQNVAIKHVSNFNDCEYDLTKILREVMVL